MSYIATSDVNTNNLVNTLRTTLPMVNTIHRIMLNVQSSEGRYFRLFIMHQNCKISITVIIYL